MTDANAATDSGSENTGKRKRVSTRDFINDGGTVVDKMEEAAGARYTLIGTENGAFDYLFGASADADRMLAIFGFLTKVGNVANSTLNDKDAPGTADEAADSIADWLDKLTGGVWTEPAKGGVGGAKVDRDALAASICEVFGPVNAARGKPAPDPVVIRERLDDDVAFFRAMRKQPEVTEAYTRRVGKEAVKVVSLDEAADML